eukprot:3755491-Rhodomonas_salina.1
MSEVRSFGMKDVGFEGCMHIVQCRGKTLILVTYVDDCLLIHDDDGLAEEFKAHIGKRFEYTEEGDGSLAWHLGV